ncbi:MAG: ornithine cyclodeaminase family protein [Candidatus Omnitrophica bacterium]|nr:ornithine cyclodeaminase family protein [Candidatus Omnitrophota bacterium]
MVQIRVLSAAHIEKAVTMKEAIRYVEKAFIAYGRGQSRMPAKVYLDLPQFKGDFRAMPAFLSHPEIAGIKWVNVHPENHKRGLPAVMGIVLLSDPRTGTPLAILEGAYLTRLRTGAAGGVAAKYLARKKSRVAALVGTGAQAAFQLEALREQFPIEEVRAWGLRRGEAKALLNSLSLGRCKAIACKDVESCVRGADIVVTQTPSRRPLVQAKWISPGTHINAIGADAPGKQELSAALLKKSRIWIDDWTQALHSGEVNVPLRKKQIRKRDICGSLSEVVLGEKQGRLSDEEITIFDSTGLAIQDMSVAYAVYNRCKRNGIGVQLNWT